MKWAFIDYENIGSLDKIDLSAYQKTIIFLGAKQPKLDFGNIKYDKPLELTIIQLKTSQLNNLDFHLSYYLGRYDSSTDKNVTFDIISNDNGFAPLISHIKTNGRRCNHIKLSMVKDINIATPVPTHIPLTVNEKLLQSLTSKPENKRPKKVAALRNHIASQMRIQGNELAIQGHFNKLVKDQAILVSNDNIIYQC